MPKGYVNPHDPETHYVAQFTHDGKRVATVSGLGRHKGTCDAGHSQRTAQRHAAKLRKEDPTHDYRAEWKHG